MVTMRAGLAPSLFILACMSASVGLCDQWPTLICDTPSKGGTISVFYGNSVAYGHVSVTIPAGVSPERKCALIAAAIRQTEQSKIGSLFDAELNGNQLGVGGSRFIQVQSDSTGEVYGLTEDSPLGQSTAATEADGSNQDAKPAAGTQFQITVLTNSLSCNAAVSADGNTAASTLLGSINTSLAGQGCGFTFQFTDPATGQAMLRTGFSDSPVVLVANPNFAQLATFGVVSQPPPTPPPTSDADVITSPSDGTSWVFGNPATVTISNYASHPHLVTGAYVGPTLAPFAQQFQFTLAAGKTSFQLPTEPAGATNVFVRVCTQETGGCLSTNGSSANYALVDACPITVTGLTSRITATAFQQGQGTMQANLLLTNNTTQPFDLSVLKIGAIEVLQNPTPSTQPANLLNADGTLPIGCPYAGFSYMNVFPATLLPPGQTQPVHLDFPVDKASVSGLTIQPIVMEDAPAACLPPKVSCSSTFCVNTSNDPNNCGGCGVQCSSTNDTPQCTSGACTSTCNIGFGNCNGTLGTSGCNINLNTDTSNCGTCGNACSFANAGSACVGGACAIGSCSAGWGNCDGNSANGCETQLNTLTNCGACGGTCAVANGTPTCSTGTCAVQSCNFGWGDCDHNPANGCETSLFTTQNCFACGNVCTAPPNATPYCSSLGSCAWTCQAGYNLCTGPTGTGCCPAGQE